MTTTISSSAALAIIGLRSPRRRSWR